MLKPSSPSSPEQQLQMLLLWRHLGWLLASPLFLCLLARLAAGDAWRVGWLVLVDLLRVLSCWGASRASHAADGDAGGLVQKYGLFLASLVFYGLVVKEIQPISGLRGWAIRVGALNQERVGVVCDLVVFLWTTYPVCWLLAEGLGVLSVGREILCYGILDLLSKIGGCHLS